MSVPDEVYRDARIRAAEQGTSLSGLVTRYLQSLSARDAEFARLEALQHQVMAEIRDSGFDGSDRLTRDEVHDRSALR